EIVLGKLLGSLLQIGLLLAGTVPIMAMCLLLGGVDPLQVVQTVLILAATTWAAGSLGGLVALWRERTFQALALTVLFLVLFFCLGEAPGALPVVAGWWIGSAPTWSVASWQRWLNPRLALQSVLAPANEAEGLAPAYGFAIAMTLIG